MAIEAELCAPVRIYVHKDEEGYSASIDPFSVLGIGETEKGAIDNANELLMSHLSALGEAVAKYGPSKVRVLTPLTASEKRDAVRTYRGQVTMTFGIEETKKAPELGLWRKLNSMSLKKLLPRLLAARVSRRERVKVG